MILERLTDFHARIADEIIPSYHKRQDVRWILSITADGQFEGFVETDNLIDAPYMKRSGSKPPPYLLVDKPGYVVGLPRSESEKHRKSAAWRHDAYIELVEACAEAAPGPALEAYLTFLAEHVEEAHKAAAEREMKVGDLIAPRVDGHLLTASEEVRAFWIDAQDRAAAEKSNLEAECLICGEEQPIARTHPVELQLGPDRVGLITGNADAFLSYGLEQSEIAPVCQPCARTYGEALRYLLTSEKHRLRLADVTWVFWTREPIDADPFGLLSRADETEVKNLLESVYGTHPAEAEANDFYALALTSNISRLAVRSWLTATVSEVQKRLAAYFERMRLSGRDGQPRYHGVYALAGSLVREFNESSKQAVAHLVRHALQGRRRPLPLSLLHQAVRRARADDYAMTHPRAALIKLVLLSQSNPPEDLMEQLNENHSSAAYQCGRLLAVLEGIQQRAINPNTTLVDRYYGTASTAPASVFGNLMRGVQSHLSKLRRDEDTRGLYHYFNRQIEEIASRLDGFPRTLTMEQQGLFALGYYQQRHRPAKKEAEVEAVS